MTRELFGTDGIRARAGQYPLDDATVGKVGWAIAKQFELDGKTVLIGQDTRESSPSIVASLAKGLSAGGAMVKLVGVIPTPGLAYLTNHTGAEVGVMVTASHNPYEDNGIKVFKAGGHKLTDDEEVNLNRLITEAEEPGVESKSEEAHDLVGKYKEFLIDSANGIKLDGLKLAVDTANGAASEIAAKVFERLGADVAAMFNQPDGRNINAGCGATDTKAISQRIIDEGLDGGVALDGDADRLVLLDRRGRELNGDHILYILAVRTDQTGVVATVMTNFGLEKTLSSEGIKLHRTAVGDRYMLEELRSSGLNLAAEQSGHIIINDLQPTGDGLLAAIKVLCEVKKSGKSLDRWRDEVEMLPQAIVNITVEDKAKLDSPPIQKLIAEQALALGDSGRLLVRASGTEPLIRVMVEGPDATEAAASIAGELEAAMAKI